MLTRAWIGVIIFVSSYSPLAAILFIKDLHSNPMRLDHPILAWTVVGIGVVSTCVLFMTVSRIEDGQIVTPRTIRTKANELVNYTIPYMISFFGFDLSSTRDILVFLCFMALMCFLTIRTQSIFVNPLLALAGYGLYDVTYEERGSTRDCVFLSKVELMEGTPCEIRRLGRFLCFVIENENRTTTEVS